jgi:hypothetical protein
MNTLSRIGTMDWLSPTRCFNTEQNNVYNSYPGASSFWLSWIKPKRLLLIRGYIQHYRECIRCSHHGRGCFKALYSFWYLTPGVLEWCWPVRARIARADGLEMELVTDCDRETRGYSCALWPHDGTTTPEDDVSTAREEGVIGNWLKLALPITTHMIHVLTRCHFVYIQSYKHNNNANTNHIRGRYRECIRCSHHGWGCFNAQSVAIHFIHIILFQAQILF